MVWLARAPANIALIKYMGKKDGNSNLPDNASLSFTLNNLLSTVQLESHSVKRDIWEPLPTQDLPNFSLSSEAQH
ncbi:MAG: diphosphomevalonate decarboxylase, partial [Legionellales bacterium]